MSIFAITELLEAILLQLPERNVLVFQRVCQQWQHTIVSSPALQNKLFLTPLPHLDDPVFNPLLKELFPFLLSSKQVPGYYSGNREWNNESEMLWMEWYKDEMRRAQVLREDASWRKMFPVQPPAMVEGVKKCGGCQCAGNEWINMSVKEEYWNQEKEGGLRMGGLWDLLVHILEGEPQRDREFFVEWMMFPVMVPMDDDDEAYIEPEWTDDEAGEREENEETLATITGLEWRSGEAVRKNWMIVPAKKNAIVFHNDHSRECYPSSPAPSIMKITAVNEDVLEIRI
ncbi:hypothetical protein VTL71DRAFT_2666 [Oculimacula yallundae]|uniref:F-box domain-containing protein n=1 Tax=Oculimacula yallundae TaxID=86028 RepID=A0ABR4C9Y8_9HELO